MKRWAPWALALVTAAGLALAGSNGVGTGGLTGFPNAGVGSGSTLGPGCVVTATGIYCVVVDAGTVYAANGKFDVLDSGVLNVEGQIGAAGPIIGRAATNTNALAVATSGARVDFGAGAADYASSDGTTVTFANHLSVAGTLWGKSAWANGAGGSMLGSGTAPTVVACSGTAASIVWANGSFAFKFDVGTSCAGESTATITFGSSASDEWSCSCFIRAGTVTNLTQTSGSATTAVLTNYSKTLGTAVDFADGDDVQCMCLGG